MWSGYNIGMAIKEIVALLDSQIAVLKEARELLKADSTGSVVPRKAGRPRKAENASAILGCDERSRHPQYSASSTRIPTASAMPPSVMIFTVSPSAASTAIEAGTDSGIETSTISVNRHDAQEQQDHQRL